MGLGFNMVFPKEKYRLDFCKCHRHRLGKTRCQNGPSSKMPHGDDSGKQRSNEALVPKQVNDKAGWRGCQGGMH